MLTRTFFSIRLLFAILPSALVHGADLQKGSIQEIDTRLEYVPKIIRASVYVRNHLKQPITVSVEGVNFCDINPGSTHTSPLNLTFTKLSDEVVVYQTYISEINYTHNVLAQSSKKELLPMYPRLCVETMSNVKKYFKLRRDGRNIQLKMTVCLDERSAELKVDEDLVYLQIPYEELWVHKFHFMRYIADKKDQYGVKFLKECESYFNAESFDALSVVQTKQTHF